jgi:hypothetical protein
MNLSSRNFQKLIVLNGKCDYKSQETQMYPDFVRKVSVFGKASGKIAAHLWITGILKAEAAVLSLGRLTRRFSSQRFEAACERVLFYGYNSSRMVKMVLLQKLDLLPLDAATDIYGQPSLF